MSRSVILTCSCVSFGYGKSKRILEEISLTIESGSWISLIGGNGVGKSTLLKLLARREVPQTGTIQYGDKSYEEISLRELSRQVSYLEQFPAVSDMVLLDYVLHGALPEISAGRFWFNAEEKGRANDLIDSMDLQECRFMKVSELSGGERQLAQICRSLMTFPSLILLDEPVSHLDMYHAEIVVSAIKRIQRETGLAVVSILHDINLAYSCSDSLMLIDSSGKLEKLTGNCKSDQPTLELGFNTRFELLTSETTGEKRLIPQWGFSTNV